ncbi:MAG: hypothetical protein ACYS0K_23395 [Planctomycetota bacterium]|jgi:hypothetical protein
MQYRAAYWASHTTRVEEVLTTPKEAKLPDDELLAIARAEAKRRKLDLKAGKIVIGTWTWGDLLSGA